jgi:hypothetical protein
MAKTVDKPMAKTVAVVAKDMAKRSTSISSTTSTYRYRDPEKRRAYMRKLMRKRRARAKQPSK